MKADRLGRLAVSGCAGQPRLSLARLFLFGARDVWFVVGIPVLTSGRCCRTARRKADARPFLIGGFLALWIIAYGAVQAMAPRLLGAKGQPEAETTRKAIFWAGLPGCADPLPAGRCRTGRRGAAALADHRADRGLLVFRLCLCGQFLDYIPT